MKQQTTKDVVFILNLKECSDFRQKKIESALFLEIIPFKVASVSKEDFTRSWSNT